MNPYLEQVAVWQDFHQTFLPVARELLNAQVAPRYVVKIEEHIYVHEAAEVNGRMFAGRADVAVTEASLAPGAGDAVALLDAPAWVRVPAAVDVERSSYLEIRNRDERQLIAVLELLSPSNKSRERDREQYLAKREHVLESSAHFIEIDLLRGGPRLPWEELTACDYYVVVSRASERPKAGFWPLGLREPLPNVPVPLAAGDPHAVLDLKQILDRVYDSAGYGYYIYQSEPEPALSSDDAAWARQYIPPAS
jgi:hypothetical protein